MYIFLNKQLKKIKYSHVLIKVSTYSINAVLNVSRSMGKIVGSISCLKNEGNCSGGNCWKIMKNHI